MAVLDISVTGYRKRNPDKAEQERALAAAAASALAKRAIALERRGVVRVEPADVRERRNADHRRRWAAKMADPAWAQARREKQLAYRARRKAAADG